jgi:hypothetical protein
MDCGVGDVAQWYSPCLYKGLGLIPSTQHTHTIAKTRQFLPASSLPFHLHCYFCRFAHSLMYKSPCKQNRGSSAMSGQAVTLCPRVS